ncbi:MAG TPA: radical SAM protein, partial [Methanocorpusculum sp.]|nr:radical SAM protein [Methanocorpusculum sp.]
DIIKMCEKHSDCIFLSFTNGTLIDEEFAQEMLRVGNFIPAISVEGDAEATNGRRGENVYERLTKGMEILKRNKLPFGISCCYTSKNVEAIGNDAFIDDMISKGAKFAWFFTYMPVGRDAVPELIAKPEQREHMYRFVRHIRETRPIFALDFWNDGEYVNGCVAGGRFYLHINANGDIEPCAFIHYSDSNIREKTLLEAYKSPLFMQYHANQPFNENHLRPCPCLDNPHKLVEMVEKSGAKSTDVQAPEDVHDLAAKCKPVSEEWGKHADELWKENRAAKMASAEE